MTRYVGTLMIKEESILNSLGYNGGNILRIGKSEDRLAVMVMIEHPDMPPAEEGFAIPLISTVMLDLYDFAWLRLYPRRRWHSRITEGLKAFWYVLTFKDKVPKGCI